VAATSERMKVRRSKRAGTCRVDILTGAFGAKRNAVENRKQDLERGQSAESALEFGRRLQRHQFAGLRNRGSCSIPTAPTNILTENKRLASPA
jgi:hypothetical protein